MELGQVFLRVYWLYLIRHIPPTVRVNTAFSTIQIYFYGRVATQSSDRIDRVRRGSEVKHSYIIYYSPLLNVFSFLSYSCHKEPEEEVKLISYLVV